MHFCAAPLCAKPFIDVLPTQSEPFPTSSPGGSILTLLSHMRKWKVLKVLSSERMEQVSSCIYGSPILCFFYDTKLHPFCDEGTLLSLILNWIFLFPFTDLLAI